MTIDATNYIGGEKIMESAECRHCVFKVGVKKKKKNLAYSVNASISKRSKHVDIFSPGAHAPAQLNHQLQNSRPTAIITGNRTIAEPIRGNCPRFVDALATGVPQLNGRGKVFAIRVLVLLSDNMCMLTMRLYRHSIFCSSKSTRLP